MHLVRGDLLRHRLVELLIVCLQRVILVLRDATGKQQQGGAGQRGIEFPSGHRAVSFAIAAARHGDHTIGLVKLLRLSLSSGKLSSSLSTSMRWLSARLNRRYVSVLVRPAALPLHLIFICLFHLGLDLPCVVLTLVPRGRPWSILRLPYCVAEQRCYVQRDQRRDEQ